MIKEFNLVDILDKKNIRSNKLFDYNFKFIVYRFFNKDNNKSYVGSTNCIVNRLYNYKYGHITSILTNTDESNKPLYVDMKTNINSFIFIIEEIFLDRDSMFKRESELVMKFDSYNNGYNLTKDGYFKGGCYPRGFTIGKKVVNKDGKSYIIKPELINLYLSNGYNLGRADKRKRMNNGIHNINVLLSDIEKYKLLGYKLGSLPRKYLVSLGEEEIWIEKSDLNDYLSRGYKKGHNDKFISRSKGYITINNGINETKIPSDKLKDYLSKGYSLGGIKSMRKKTKGTTGKKFINNGDTSIAVDESSMDKFLSDGWVIGRLPNKKNRK